MSQVDIIIPTWNLPEYVIPCVDSIIRYTMTEDLYHIYVVNNGNPEHMEPLRGNHWVTILQQEKNLGWEGGLKAGLAVSKSPYVLFMNDDTYVPPHQRLWINQLLSHFESPNCAAAGPTSNVVMGIQNVFNRLPESIYRSKFLIGFCLLVRRSDLDAAGGVDDTLPGGDDLDLSIRLRKLGKYLIVNREVFVWHHGFKSGVRKHGSDWNSADMIERTNHALIRKHGLRTFLDLWGSETTPAYAWQQQDSEGQLVRKFVQGPMVAEIGCGDNKTVPDSIGIDIVPSGQQIPGLALGRLSVADKIADVTGPLPVSDGSFDTIIAKHILEHCVDTLDTLRHWANALKHGGRLIIAVPNHNLRNTIPMNVQHVHAFTPQSLQRLMEKLGWKTVGIEDPKNFVSFVGAFEKNGVS